MGTIAATTKNQALTLTLGTLSLGSIFAALEELLGGSAGMGWDVAAGYVLLVSAICAWYTASALMFEGVSGRAVLPVGRYDRTRPEGSVGRPRRGRAGCKEGTVRDGEQGRKGGMYPCALFLAAFQVMQNVRGGLLRA
jgi:uncharacterized protein